MSNHPASFATTGYNPTVEAPDLDFTFDPRAEYLSAERLAYDAPPATDYDACEAAATGNGRTQRTQAWYAAVGRYDGLRQARQALEAAGLLGADASLLLLRLAAEQRACWPRLTSAGAPAPVSIHEALMA